MIDEPEHDEQPQRLRDIIREEEEHAEQKTRKRRRFPYVIVIPLLVVVVLVLGYGLLERNVLRPHVDSTVEVTDSLVRAGEHIQINVVNACGVDGMAARITEFLRARRFDVPEYGTAAALEPNSKVIDRVGDLESAYKVAYALGIDREHVVTDVDSSLHLRATVIIGEDYLKLRPHR